MKVLVTGGAGFIGSHLTDGLLERGYDVRILDALIPQVHGTRKKASGLSRSAGGASDRQHRGSRIGLRRPCRALNAWYTWLPP